MGNYSGLRQAALAFTAITACTLLLLVTTALSGGIDIKMLISPVEWLGNLDPAVATSMLGTASEVTAGVLAIAITVVAIVVELAANRYSHRLTNLFVRDPLNIGVLSLYVLTTLMCLWVSSSEYNPASDASLPQAGFAITMTLVSLSLLILLPYFAYVFAFISPVSIIGVIRTSGYQAVQRVTRKNHPGTAPRVISAIDELQDVTRSAIESNDRSIAMESINALAALLRDYEAIKPALPASWFQISPQIKSDPDFVSLESGALENIEREQLWLEVKIFRQYLSLMGVSVVRARDVAYLIAINTKEIGIAASSVSEELVTLVIRCFNSYLRAALNARDPRTAYYVMNQYRLLAEHLVSIGQENKALEIAGHFKFYGQLAFDLQLPFLLEVTAYDLMHLLEVCAEQESAISDEILELLLQLDQEIKSEKQEASLIGIRRAQIQLATFFLCRKDRLRAERICDDLSSEPLARLQKVCDQLSSEEREQFWEFTDRGINFAYLEPKYRPYLDTLLTWIKRKQQNEKTTRSKAPPTNPNVL